MTTKPDDKIDLGSLQREVQAFRANATHLSSQRRWALVIANELLRIADTGGLCPYDRAKLEQGAELIRDAYQAEAP